jgi:murein DD-endopeptidase MepM/ murein hydrolase activator NlpD
MRRLAAHLCLALPLACPAVAAADDGGAPSAPPPSVTAVKCKRSCAGEGMARKGSRIVVKGTQLGDVVRVTFTGPASAVPRTVTDTRLVVRVPRGAVSGPLVLTDSLGQVSAASPELQILRPAALKLSAGPIATTVMARRAFIDGARRPTLSYRLQTGEATGVTVSVVSQASHTVVKSYDEGVVEPGALRAIAWDGTTADDRQAPQGRYTFVVSTRSTTGASTAQTPAAEAFVLLGHMFPIRGKHDFGAGAGRFGAGRSGHSHQGQDVFARCGTPLVAARGGVVKMQKFQANAGNYLVIDNAGEGTDTMYAHLRDAALVHKGDRVHTGDPIGFVGDTGDAQGCHLHFEEWEAPGWYTGGSPFDPLPDLKAWDAVS